MMSRKDYIAMAEAIKPTLLSIEADAAGGDPVRREMVIAMRKAQIMTVRALALTLKADNSAFQAGRFFEACGITEQDMEGSK